MMCMAACTNNGDIGDLYGLWAVDACTADGVPADAETFGDFYWRFQGKLVAINKMIGAHEHLEWVGLYEHSGQHLMLDFSEGEIDTEFYPSQIGLTPGIMKMEILRLSDSRLELRYDAPTGVIWEYTLRKLK